MKAFWMLVRKVHWMSSAFALIGMLLFAITGITLNHAADIKVKPSIITKEAVLPSELVQSLSAQDKAREPLPKVVVQWLKQQKIHAAHQLAEWNNNEVYLALPRAGGDAWLSIDRQTGEMLYEDTDRGWIAYLNDLHKGRNTGTAWRWFLDIFSVICVLFCLTGLALLWRYQDTRSSTWPLVVAGLFVPILVLVIFH